MRKTIEWVVVVVVSVFIFYCALTKPSVKESAEQRVNRIYQQLSVQTGVTLGMPISVSPLPVFNAYNTGSEIVIYQGLIDKCKNDDELALVIAHEIAHSTLSHFELSTGDAETQAGLEAQADKMGAVYIMKAGWDVCKARNLWKRLLKEGGDYLGADHPSIAYRYTQLNFGCGDV